MLQKFDSYLRLYRQFAMMLVAGLLSHAAYAETPGKDGDLTVSGAVTVNQYAAIATTVSSGATSVTAVGLAAAMPGLAPGDLVMLYQARGATISTVDTSAYGAVTALNGAGNYEYQTVASVSGNTITFASYGTACTGLRYGYSTAGKAQIIRVPQYRNLTVNSGGSITPLAWNGTLGGVVAVHVSATLSNNGAISASAAGFRGGAIDSNTTVTTIVNDWYRRTASTDGAEKGESIAGYQTDYDAAGRYGRGAPANGGGGGNGHNGGGGGGANGNNGNTWAGQGVPDNSNSTWASGWNLDPTLNASTNNSGGGRGGYTYAGLNEANGYSAIDLNALTAAGAPGATAWGGDYRRERGGLGGRPLTYAAASQVYFGGGGGAGDGNNGSSARGGNGGGLVMIVAGTISGSGQFVTNGEAGASTISSHNDAPGGGGGGGTIVAMATSVGSSSFTANGGKGGDQFITYSENEGPGGGGGGGVVAVSTGGIRTANGGFNGTTTSSALTEFIPNGATKGATGQASATAPTSANLPFCYAPAAALQVQKTSGMFETTGINKFSVPGADVVYTITVTNPSQEVDSGTLLIADTLPAQIEFLNADYDGAGPGTTPFEFVEGTIPSGVSCCTAAQIQYSSATTGTDWTYVPAAGYDANVKRVRVTPTGKMAAALSGSPSFSLRLKARIK